MPELPEVETTLLGLKPHLMQRTIKNIIVRHHQLRWPIPQDIQHHLQDQSIENMYRRGKYLLITTTNGTVIIHLGMSGRLSLVKTSSPAGKHDHIDVQFHNDLVLRYTDPRRFGAFLWTPVHPIEQHPLLNQLGIEPFDSRFTGDYLWQKAQKRRMPIKAFIMNHHIVVGVGNIYATEALFLSGIHPAAPAYSVTQSQMQTLCSHIKDVLHRAILQGGTTLKDFLGSDGKPGYFNLKLQIYGRAGSPCHQCNTLIEKQIIAQRNSAFCPRCQPLDDRSKTIKK
ncbi:MAG TPA: bifunctional DNA-formamidopyrimidine glycosylase/DNA-(apurinic or apyrimidinic site) lyase [Legionellaceae bacterium]|nr:bifunctional DNA-formamidopyrimidine glycosylase/DNA-(apurinic or apyrimidinic site) lyase [Legionellaceae bacterium]